jgi:hypothetical protein
MASAAQVRGDAWILLVGIVISVLLCVPAGAFRPDALTTSVIFFCAVVFCVLGVSTLCHGWAFKTAPFARTYACANMKQYQRHEHAPRHN